MKSIRERDWTVTFRIYVAGWKTPTVGVGEMWNFLERTNPC